MQPRHTLMSSWHRSATTSSRSWPQHEHDTTVTLSGHRKVSFRDRVAVHHGTEADMPEQPADEPELDPIDVEPTDNSAGALVDLNRVQETEDEYRRRQPEDTSESL
jgi:hypothetical protein